MVSASTDARRTGVATPWWSDFVRPKGNVDPITLTVLTVLACLPLFLIFSRIVAMPWGESLPLAGIGWLRDFGDYLNQEFTLQWVPPSDRSSILYLLLLPTGAVLVALTRLTLGVRVLGLRAILVAIGFQAVGVLPSLMLMAVIIGLIVLVRPWTRRVGLPLYARLTLILSLAATVMVGALLIAPWLHSDAIWSVAFFPVIIMAMFAEGVAKTIEQDHIVSAIWRAVWTIVLALIIAVIDGTASRFSYQFPELLLTQLVSIVFIAEFLDLRLLEKWPDRLARLVDGTRPWYNPKPRVAVVRNRDQVGVIGQLGRRAPERYRRRKVQRQVDALREQGFDVKVFEGDTKLLSELRKFLPPDPRRGTPGGIVFNLALGLQGEGRFTHVPAMLEMAGVPYTGPDPLTQALLADRFAMLTMLAQVDVPVPHFELVGDPVQEIDLDFPCAARPRFEPDAKRIVVRNEQSLRAAVREFRRVYGHPTVIEKIVRGREIRVGLLGNEIVECLPLLEHGVGPSNKTCPASLEEPLAEQIRHCALAAYRALGCRDYARIDVRVPPFGTPVVIDVKWADLFARKGSLVTAAAAGGYPFPVLMRRIVNEAARRYVARAAVGAESAASVVSLAEKRAASG